MAALRKLVIAAHTFPPAPGIGGRRWAKHAKFLHRSGIQVSVLAAKLDETGSPWTDDVSGIAQFAYTHRFPHVLQGRPEGPVDKVAYRLALATNRLLSAGTPYDRALYDRKAFTGALHDLLSRERPDALVVTAAPFRLPWYALDLRAAFPEVAFVVDLRDPWTSGESYGYRELKGRRKAFEAAAERSVVEGFDLVTTPWPGLVDELRGRYPGRKDHIALVPHCYDPDEVKACVRTDQREVPRVVYGGNLYQGFEPLYARLAALAAEGVLEADFWVSPKDTTLRPLAHETFRVHPATSSTSFFAEAAQADWLLLPIPEVLRNGRPTKLFEYAALGVPILAAGASGSLSAEIEARGLGHFIPMDGGVEPIGRIVTSGPHIQPDMDWVRRHAAPAVVEQLAVMIEKLKHD